MITIVLNLKIFLPFSYFIQNRRKTVINIKSTDFSYSHFNFEVLFLFIFQLALFNRVTIFLKWPHNKSSL